MKYIEILKKAQINSSITAFSWNEDIYHKAQKNAFLIRDRCGFLDLEFYSN